MDAIKEISELPSIQHIPIVESSHCFTKEFSISSSYSGKSVNLVFTFLEPLSRIVYKGSPYYGDPYIQVVYSSEPTIKLKRYKLKSIFIRVFSELSYPAGLAIPNLEDVVTDRKTGKCLAMI